MWKIAPALTRATSSDASPEAVWPLVTEADLGDSARRRARSTGPPDRERVRAGGTGFRLHRAVKTVRASHRPPQHRPGHVALQAQPRATVEPRSPNRSNWKHPGNATRLASTRLAPQPAHETRHGAHTARYQSSSGEMASPPGGSKPAPPCHTPRSKRGPSSTKSRPTGAVNTAVHPRGISEIPGIRRDRIWRFTGTSDLLK